MTNLLAICLSALLSVESSNGRDAKDGDNGLAVGVLQMWPCAVAEANRITGNRNRWTTADRRDQVKAKAMCLATLAWHYRRGVRDPVELACRWNRPDGKAAVEYRNKVKRAMKGKG